MQAPTKYGPDTSRSSTIRISTVQFKRFVGTPQSANVVNLRTALSPTDRNNLDGWFTYLCGL